jgi:hypothetical protein
MNTELQSLHEHEVLERRRTALYLSGLIAASIVVVVGLMFAIGWIALTVGGG